MSTRNRPRAISVRIAALPHEELAVFNNENSYPNPYEWSVHVPIVYRKILRAIFEAIAVINYHVDKSPVDAASEPRKRGTR
jgi:hypothetical protein